MKPIDLKTWPRAEHFLFYLPFHQPAFNVTVNLDMASLYQYAKARQYSFTACYLYCLSEAVNRFAPMKYRIHEKQPVEVNDVILSCVFLKGDDSFRFVPLSKQPSLECFIQHLAKQKQKFLALPLANESFKRHSQDLNQMYISILPWLEFSSFKHAESDTQRLGIPKVVFGKYDQQVGKMPVNIEVDHALMDGLHISQFIDVFNQVVAEKTI